MEPKKAAHTPVLPSVAPISFDGWGLNGHDEYKSRIATFVQSANAHIWGPEIVRCVNSHEELVNTLKDLAHYCHDQIDQTGLQERVGAVLRKAEGKD